MNEGGSVDEVSLSLKRICVGGLGRGGGLSSFNGVLEDTLRKSPDADICLHGGPFPAERNLVGGEARIPGTLIDE